MTQPYEIRPQLPDIEIVTAAGRDGTALEPAFFLTEGAIGINVKAFVTALEAGGYSMNDVLYARARRDPLDYLQIDPNEPPSYTIADEYVELDNKRQLLIVDGEVRSLEPVGWRILKYLAVHVDTVVSKQELAKVAWSHKPVPPGDVNNNLSVQVGYIRRALGPDLRFSNKDTGAVRFKRGVGYMAVSKLAS